MVETALVFLLQLAIILIVTRAGSYLAIRLKLAPVIGELAGGLVLGPTVFGFLLPAWHEFLFPVASTASGGILQRFSSLGIILLIFVGGLEIDMTVVRRNLGRALVIAATSLAVTFGLGYLLAGLFPADLFPTPNPLAFRLFFALNLSEIASPIIIKILMDLKLLNTRFGTTTVVAWVIVDTLGWIILGIITRGTAVGFSGLEVLKTLGLIIAFVAITFTLGRLLLRRLVKLQVSEDALSVNFLASVLALMLLGAAATEYLHVHPILGAFTVGLMVGMWPLSHRIKEKIGAFAFSFFIPIFFASQGLRANLLDLDSGRLWGWALLIIGVSWVVPFLGGFGGAKLAGLTWLESRGVGTTAITKGALGLVVASVACDLGVFPPSMFAVLMVVAIVLTIVPIIGLQLMKGKFRGEAAAPPPAVP
jgi:Kef-type K+ transport system membrane component KefB